MSISAVGWTGLFFLASVKVEIIRGEEDFGRGVLWSGDGIS
jgi:hypothetical protein